MGSVVGELHASLEKLEQSLDSFFRDPKDQSLLAGVPRQLAQMEGVLSVLGLEQAALAVMHMRELTQEILQPQAEEDPARTAARSDRLGNNLGALSFLIDMLNYQPALARKVFVYNPLKGELQGAG